MNKDWSKSTIKEANNDFTTENHSDYNYLHKNLQISAHLLDRDIHCQLSSCKLNIANNWMK